MPLHFASTIALTDLFIFGAVILFAFYGFRRGALRTLYSILRVYFSFIFTLFFYERLALVFQAMLDMSSSLARMICFTILFSAFLTIIWVTGVFLKRRISKPPETSSDLSKIGGIILGLLEGVLIVSIIIMDIGFYSAANNEDSGILLENTVSYRTVKQIAPSIESFTVGSISRLRNVSDQSESDNP